MLRGVDSNGVLTEDNLVEIAEGDRHKWRKVNKEIAGELAGIALDAVDVMLDLHELVTATTRFDSGTSRFLLLRLSAAAFQDSLDRDVRLSHRSNRSTTSRRVSPPLAAWRASIRRASTYAWRARGRKPSTHD